MGFSIIHNLFGVTSIYGNLHIYVCIFMGVPISSETSICVSSYTHGSILIMGESHYFFDHFPRFPMGFPTWRPPLRSPLGSVQMAMAQQQGLHAPAGWHGGPSILVRPKRDWLFQRKMGNNLYIVCYILAKQPNNMPYIFLKA